MSEVVETEWKEEVFMRFATYNVWCPKIDIRAEQLLAEIDKVDADAVGLQEVPPLFYEELVRECKYKYCKYVSCAGEHTDEDEKVGLAILCKHPIVEHVSLFDSVENGNSIAHNVIFEVEGIRFSVTNAHLPWDSVLEKEKQIVAVDKFIHAQKDNAHFFVLLGDFNCTLNSSVHRYLLGDQSLLGCESKPYWNDLASAHAALNNYTVAPTLDFVNNPRWRGGNTVYIPDTCDRIYVMESFHWDYVFDLCDVKVFGTDVSQKTGFAPSDHYGVLAEVKFSLS